MKAFPFNPERSAEGAKSNDRPTLPQPFWLPRVDTAGRFASGVIDRPIGAIAVGALVVRVAALVLQGPTTMSGDGDMFVRTAHNLLAGHGYLGMHGTIDWDHAPLYPLLIAAGMAIARNGQACALAISIVAGALLCVPVYGLGRRIFDARAGALAAGIVAIHPALIDLSLQVEADQLGLTLELTGLYFLMRWLDEERGRDLALCGIAAGLAYLAREEALMVAAIAAAYVCARQCATPVRLARSLALVLLPCALLVTPYAAFLTRVTGHVRLEAKSAINYAIGVRMQRGMNYGEAADGLGPNLQEVGAELGGGYYAIHPDARDPSLPERLAFAAPAEPQHLADLLSWLRSLRYGSPLMLVAAVLGVGVALRRRRSAVRGGVLLAGLAGNFVALASVEQFWDRYATPYAPYVSVFAAAGFVLAAHELARRAPLAVPAKAARLGAALLGAAIVLGSFAATVKDLRANATDPRPAMDAAAWIDAHEPGPRTIASVSGDVPYYAGDTAIALPYATSARTLAYLRRKRPDLIVLEPPDVARPYLAAWRAHGIPDPRARLGYTSSGPAARAIEVYAYTVR